MKRAIHFGAGNIGRGFVGFLLQRAGYHVTFVDVNAALIDEIANADTYTVHEVGPGGEDYTVSSFDGINSQTNLDAAVAAVAGADLVTCAVGPTVLKFIAPVIGDGLAARTSETPLAVMACENAINATDALRGYIEDARGTEVSQHAIYANTAVDRIVPQQPEGAGLDVFVEPFFEWAIESTPFGDTHPEIPGVHWVPDLSPFIERKLFTVNTGHATTAYFGFLEGVHAIADALAIPSVREHVEAALHETKELIISKYDNFTADEQEAYIQTILTRFANPKLTDTVERVGRQPLRKLSRHERFVGPASELAAAGKSVDGLVSTIGAALRFDVPEDPQSVEMKKLLASKTSEEFVAEVTGLTPDDALYAAVLAQVQAVETAQ